MPNIDPELKVALEESLDRNRNLQVIVTLVPPAVVDGRQVDFHATLSELLIEASEESEEDPLRIVPFQNLNAFSINASARFIDSLLCLPRVASATLN